MCTMPETTRLSSTDAHPLRPRGSSGSFRDHSASLHHVNCRYAIQTPPSSETLKQAYEKRAILLSTVSYTMILDTAETIAARDTSRSDEISSR